MQIHEDECLGQGGWVDGWMGASHLRGWVRGQLEWGSWSGSGVACRVPAAKLRVPGRYFVQTGETAGLTRTFLLFLLPL